MAVEVLEGALDHEAVVHQRLGKSVGLDIERLKRDMEDKSLHALIAQHVNEFDQAGLDGTPGFFINGKYVAGFDQQSLEALIAEARDGKKGG